MKIMKAVWLATLAAALLGTAAFAPTFAVAEQSAGKSKPAAEQYLRAVPSGPSQIHCRRICVRTVGGSKTHPPVCAQWRTIC